MIEKLKRRVSLLVAYLGIFLLKRSGIFIGYFAEWRWAAFDRGQRSGLHILPVHYYSPVPDVSRIKLDEQTPFFAEVGLETLNSAISSLEELVVLYGDDFAEIASRGSSSGGESINDFQFGRAPYSTVEAELLYGLIRLRKPERIIEIGCGHTTLLISEAIRAERDSGYSPSFECIEPYRPNYLKPAPLEVTKFSDVPLQSVPISKFQELHSGDMLFIDSSHVVSYGSDVVYEIATILPRLRAGVLVHFHDIFLPYEYPSKWLRESKFFWNEQYMLSALVQDNPRYYIRFPLHQVFRQRRSDIERLFPQLKERDHTPSAYWIEILDRSQGSDRPKSAN